MTQPFRDLIYTQPAMEPLFEIDPIVLKYVLEEPLSREESALLDTWVSAAEGRAEFLAQAKNDPAWLKANLARLQDTDTDPVWIKVESRLRKEGYWLPERETPALLAIARPTGRRWVTYVVAATVILVVGGTALRTLFHHPMPQPSAPITPTVAEVQPGGNKAVLTLADGRRINLDSSTNGVLAAQGTMNVSKTGDGALAYNKSAAAESGAATSSELPIPIAYNSLSTPRAGQFTLTLPDGTRVWLNNASTLRYPVAFTGADRPVELTGEAYFEVAKDRAHPFRVIVHRGAAGGGGSIDVLGTSFNVMAYDDEPAERTTLVEGGVKFNLAQHSVVLRPEQQAVLDEHGTMTVVHANVGEVTSWKNGYFHFDHASLQTTMRQLARWYDIDVTYQGDMAEQEFMGRIQRSLPLADVLKGLENDKVHFKLEGRKLTVMP
jgi:transmembrane sensor